MQTLDASTFSLWLNPNPAAEPAGSLQFGGINATLYSGELAPLQVISSKCAPAPCCALNSPPPCHQVELGACMHGFKQHAEPGACLQGPLQRSIVPCCRYWMVPLTGASAGNKSVSLLARAAILASSSALSQVTRKDYAQLGRVSIPVCDLS